MQPTLRRLRISILILGTFHWIEPVAAAPIPAAPEPSAAELTRYDTNRDGRLDASEQAAQRADQEKALQAGRASSTAGSHGAEVVELSPFEVVENTRGYLATSTMSGTRFNSKLDDLASSIVVMTKEQMTDFAMLDLNDVFLYAGNTEGTGNYTDVALTRNGDVIDNVQGDPTQANRIRGIGPANLSLGNMETTGRVPVDPAGVDAVEISRGPNANVFGLGNGAGTVNLVPASANLSTPRSQVSLRVDSYGGHRSSLDLNRILKPGVAALRATAVFQHDAYDRKPAGADSRRFNGMLKVRPFRNTTITGSYSYYRMHGTRPNSVPPRDAISYWRDSGRPTWDPITQQVHLNGRTIGTFPSATGLPDYFSGSSLGNDLSQVFVDREGIGYWAAPTTTSGANPNANLQATRLLTTRPAPVRTGQSLFATTPTAADRSLYDWTSINYAAYNRYEDETETSHVQVEQIFFNTPRQMLVGQAGWMREDSERWARSPVSFNGAAYLQVDINERLLDGSPNPYFMRPYIGVNQPSTTHTPQRWDTFRGQLAYRLDLTGEKNWLRWFGRHQLTGYQEYKYRLSRKYSFRDAIVSNHSWLPAGVVRANQQNTNPSPNLTRNLFRYYVGDSQGQNVDYAPGTFDHGTYPYVWGNAATGVFNREPAQLGLAATQDSSGGSVNLQTLLRTQGAVVQSHFLRERVVTTLGVRIDDTYTKFAQSAGLMPDGLTHNHAVIDHWAPGDYDQRDGRTSQRGIVVRPLRDWKFLQRPAGAGGGFTGILSDFLRTLALSYNESNSFLPARPAQNIFYGELPNPTGEGKDYGVSFNLFDGKLVVRINRYRNSQINTRDGEAATLVSRVLSIDFEEEARGFNLERQAAAWVRQFNPAFTNAQVVAEVERIMGVSSVLHFEMPRAETSDVTAKGHEIEINFNPTPFWTLQASFNETQSIDANLSANLAKWIEQRMPIWTNVVDPRSGQKWWTTFYQGQANSPESYFRNSVRSSLEVIRALDGKSRPQVSRYSARVSTNLRLAGVTDQRILKRINVGGALRWKDKSAIGYFGKQQLPAVVEELDPLNPIWAKAQLYADAFIAYRTRLFANKVGTTLQLNVRNLQEGGSLLPIGAFPDGTPHTYRIVDPRQFILTMTFEL